MSCDTSKFIVTKGSNNSFTFTLKQDNSTLPLTIEPSDSFTATLTDLDSDEDYPFVTEKPLTVQDAVNGKVVLEIPEADTQDLTIDKGSKVDRYYIRPTYKLKLDCITANNGTFTAKVSQVYVD